MWLSLESVSRLNPLKSLISSIRNRQNASIARSIEIPVSDEKLVNDYMDLQEFLCDLVHDAEVAIRNPQYVKVGTEELVQAEKPRTWNEDFDLVDENGGMDGH